MNKAEVKRLRKAVVKAIETACAAEMAGAQPPEDAEIIRLETVIARNNVAYLISISTFTRETSHG